MEQIRWNKLDGTNKCFTITHKATVVEGEVLKRDIK